MDLTTIKKLVELMREHQLDELEVEEKGTKIHLRKHVEEPQKITTISNPIAVLTPPSAAESAPAKSAPEPKKEDSDEGVILVKSPLIGTFYRSPKPGVSPFVEPGSPIQKGQTLCIIEAMKVMNEIKSEVDGTVSDICVKDAEPVDFNRILLKIKLPA